MCQDTDHLEYEHGIFALAITLCSMPYDQGSEVLDVARLVWLD